mgnify:CR=1 FL=1
MLSSRLTRIGEANMGALQVPRSKTEFHRKSFLPNYTRLWNGIPQGVLLELSMPAFKK